MLHCISVKSQIFTWTAASKHLNFWSISSNSGVIAFKISLLTHSMANFFSKFVNAVLGNRKTLCEENFDVHKNTINRPFFHNFVLSFYELVKPAWIFRKNWRSASVPAVQAFFLLCSAFGFSVSKWRSVTSCFWLISSPSGNLANPGLSTNK